jgi:hypothetical protein
MFFTGPMPDSVVADRSFAMQPGIELRADYVMQAGFGLWPRPRSLCRPDS